MSLQALNSLLGFGGAYENTDLQKILMELQGLTISVVDGAAAGTKMDVAGLRTEDTILEAVKMTDTWAAPVSDLANITIQETKASATATISSTGPLNAETIVVNGVTYTFKTTPASLTDIKLGATTSETLDNMVAAINAYENGYTGSAHRTPQVVAVKTSATVVTVSSVADGAGNAIVSTNSDPGVTMTTATSGTASCTLTFATAVNGGTFTINGVVFTIRTTPTAGVLTDVLVGATNAAMADHAAAAVNNYVRNTGLIDVQAVSDGINKITMTPLTALKGNVIVFTEAATNLAFSGSGHLANGTDTGGIKSTTNLSTSTLMLYWMNKTH